MRFAVVLLFGLTACGGCTKANPNQCCTDQADCSAHGIPNGTSCDQGLVCRGNQCIAEVCTGSSDCDLSAPFCVDTSCSSMCTADNQCPGNGGSADHVHCVSGACVACRDSSDCPASAPVCSMGDCHGCAADADCASGACDLDSGTCLVESMVAYASPTGGGSASCTRNDPCTLSHAFAIVDPSRPNIKLLPGTYTSGDTFSGTFALTVYGPATANYVGYQGNNGHLRLRDLTLTGGVNCSITATNLARPALDLRRVAIMPDVTNLPGLGTSECDLVASEVSIVAARVTGAVVSLSGAGGGHSTVTMDRVLIDGGDPAFFIEDPTDFTITNAVVSHQGSLEGAFQLATMGAGGETGKVSFSTFYDTTLTCPASANVIIAFDDDIFLNENSGAPSNTVSGTGCTHRYDIIRPQSSSVGAMNMIGVDPRFVNAGSGDYHLMMGSPAIDAADPAATLSTDYDGTARPQGAGRDIGAFEYKP